MYCTKEKDFYKHPTARHNNFQWLIDVETAIDLTSESRTKLAQAKSKGLTCP